MPRKKASKKDQDNSLDQSQISSIETDIINEFGNVIVSGNHLIEQPSLVIPVSPCIDVIIGGGIQEGSFVIPTGPPKVGKTSMAIDFSTTALNTPSELTDKREAYFFNIEGRLRRRDLLGMPKLRPFLDKTFHVIQSTKERILNGEDFLDIGERLINNKPGCIFIFDSFSQLCSASRKKEHIGQRFRDDMPLFLADFCKRICNVIPINGSIIFGITHLIANQGMGMSPWTEASGRKIQYQVDYKLKASYSEPWKSGEQIIGQKVHWECFSSPLRNGPCTNNTVSYLRYGYGLDKGAEIMDIAIDMGLIKQSGAWFSLKNKEDVKIQGRDNMAMYINDNVDVYNELYSSFRTLMFE